MDIKKSQGHPLPNFAIPIECPPLKPNTVIFEPNQAADMLRLLSEYYFKIGDLQNTQSFLKLALYLSKKEAKTWMAYARLNQQIL
jgi:hypothetical protein